MTIKDLKKLLEQYDEDTELLIFCRDCNHGFIGSLNFSIEDNTKQTFGYVKLIIN